MIFLRWFCSSIGQTISKQLLLFLWFWQVLRERINVCVCICILAFSHFHTHGVSPTIYWGRAMANSSVNVFWLSESGLPPHICSQAWFCALSCSIESLSGGSHGEFTKTTLAHPSLHSHSAISCGPDTFSLDFNPHSLALSCASGFSGINFPVLEQAFHAPTQ